jgi:hypothetical protein
MQVLRGNVARLFAPGGGDRPFPYNATLFLQDGRRVVVRVFKAAAGRETRLGDGWREIYEDFNLMPGDFAVFAKSVLEDGTFHARFFDADSNERLSRFVAPDPPSSPEFRFRGSSHWLASTYDAAEVEGLRAQCWEQGAEAGRDEQAAGAGGGGDRALQGDDITIKEAMDLAVQCGAREGSDEHYMESRHVPHFQDQRREAPVAEEMLRGSDELARTSSDRKWQLHA